MKHKVLYISYDGMTDPLGQSQVLPYLSGLSRKGYAISLISFEKEERFQKFKADIESICSEAGIQWYPQKYTRRPPVLSTMYDVRRMQKLAARLHKQEQFSLLHCRSYISAMAGLWMKRKFGLPFVFDMRGFWADERVDGGLWRLSNPLYKTVFRFFKKKEKEFLNNAAAVVSLTHNAKKEILSWPEVTTPVTITVIPCCVDLNLFNPDAVGHNAILQKRNELGITDNTTVLTYIGSIGTWYLLDDMLRFFQQWLRRAPASVFVFVTTDAPDLIMEKAHQMGITADRLRITAAKRNEVPLYIAIGDYSLFFIKQAYSKKASSPTKQGEIMAMGKPAICNTGVGDTDYVIEKYHSGFLVNRFDDAAFDKVIREATSEKLNAAHIRSGAMEFFSLDNGIGSYEKVYQRILNL